MRSDILLLSGIGKKKFRRLEQKGITTVAELASLTPSKLADIFEEPNHHTSERILEQAQLFLKRQIKISDFPNLPPIEQCLYFDLEATPHGKNRKIFLASFAAVSISKTVVFFAEQNESIAEPVYRFLVNRPERYLISFSEDDWDYRALMNLFKNEGLDLESLGKKRSVNLYKQLKRFVLSPVGLGVKNFSTYLGFEGYSNELSNYRKMDGYKVALIYESGKYSPSTRKAMMRYNQVDSEALLFIHMAMERIIENGKTGVISLPKVEWKSHLSD